MTIDGKEPIRAFLGVVPEAGVLQNLSCYMQVLRKYKGYKWVSDENLHITLKFLGDMDSAQLQKLDTHLSASGGIRSFTIEIAGAGGFPSPNCPKVIWLGVREGADSLEKLASIVERVAKGAGFDIEKKKFRAHLTLARAREARDIAPDLAQNLAQAPVLKWFCNRFVLIKSVLSPQGPIYTKLREYHLR